MLISHKKEHYLIHSLCSTCALQRGWRTRHGAASTQAWLSRCQEPGFDRSAPGALLALLELGGQELQLHVILQPGEALPHPGHVSGLLFLCSRLSCHRPTRIPLQSESQSHFPTSSSTAKFLHFPSCLSQRPSCPLTLPPLAFFLLLDKPHPTHTQRSTHPRLPLDSSPPKQSQGKRGLSGWRDIPASLAALLAYWGPVSKASWLPKTIPFNLQQPAGKYPPSHPLCCWPPEQAWDPCNCWFSLWTWMETLIACRFLLLNPTSTLSCPSWQCYLAAESSDWRPSALSFLKPCCSICMSYPSGIHSPAQEYPLESQLFSVQSMMFKANGTWDFNFFPWFTLPNMSTGDLERTPKTVCKSAQAPED